jgi:PadR family transcriptional regulator PadR
MGEDRGDLLRGALEMLILKTLAEGPMHGYGITERLLASSDGVLEIDEGSMYPALYRMQSRGWIAASWGRSDNNRRAKFYRITTRGQRQLATASERWERFSGAVGKVMYEADPAGGTRSR